MVWVVLAAKYLVAVPASNPLLSHVADMSLWALACGTERRSFCVGFQTNDVGVGCSCQWQDPVPELQDTCLAGDVRSFHKRPSLLEKHASYTLLKSQEATFLCSI